MSRTNFFNRHLVESGENYFEHFLFAFATSMWLLLSSLILLCHAIFPFIFRLTASSSIKKVNEVMQKRRDTLIARIEERARNQAAKTEEE